jgi:NTE family protein
MVNPRAPRVGLALGAGGARGWAHIGAIRALADAGLKPDIVCGTSMGALVGAAYAAGELERLEAWAQSLDWKDVLALMDFTWRGGLIRGDKLFDFFRARVADRDIGTLALPFGAVATELATGREVWLREGGMFDAVRASIAIPGVFAPVLRDGELLVDGGLVNPVPVSMCRALGADVVIAVDLGWAKLGYYRERTRAKPERGAEGQAAWWERILRLAAVGKEEPAGSMPSVLHVFLTSIDVMQVRIGRSRQAGDPADALIAPILPDFAMMDWHRAREAIGEGRAATERMRPMIDHLLGRQEKGV